MQEEGLFCSFGINGLPPNHFQEISERFGIAVLNDGKQLVIPILSPEMKNANYKCYMHPGDLKYERELKSLDRFANLGPWKEKLKSARIIFEELLPQINEAWQCTFALDYEWVYFPLNGIFHT